MDRIALFDLDGTLLDSAPDIHSALDRLMAAHGRPGFSREEVRRMIGDGVPVLVQRACAARNLVNSPELVAEFLKDYEAHAADETRPFAGIPEALAALKAAGWRLAVCTNKPEKAARIILDNQKLSPLLEQVGGGDSFPVRKPHPGHPLGILARMGAEASRAVLIGDHHNDTRAAKAAGIAAVFAAWGYGTAEMAEGAPVASAPDELPDVLAGLGIG
ncbi:phosphoglycolate phosphatase [Roseomonas xinghualingensis]|uniref:phosphoglycolate phosphatase n=1 Tax=Roseomonas xinghualingensis TaxID=2986475 RepID=UPI0021F17545|nr:phosphoglycolate phosphatase [Roseomonas sp. SXEYE001]MCV4207383.1 phosphoglycolate phosphatase [Roseomonas sp. SXEYE001]